MGASLWASPRGLWEGITEVRTRSAKNSREYNKRARLRCNPRVTQPCTRSPSAIAAAGHPPIHPSIHQLSRVTIANMNVTRRRFRSSADRGGDGSPHRATAGVDLTCARALTHPCSEKKYVRYGRVKNRTDVSVHSSQRSLSHEWRRAARAPTANDKCEPLRAYSLASLFEAA